MSISLAGLLLIPTVAYCLVSIDPELFPALACMDIIRRSHLFKWERGHVHDAMSICIEV